MVLLPSDATLITNKKWVLRSRPDGVFQSNNEVVEIVEEQIALCDQQDVSLSSDTEESDGSGGKKEKHDENGVQLCPDDHIVVKVYMLSVDAFIRTMMDEEGYHGTVEIGGTLPALGYGRVVYVGNNVRCFRVGSQVKGMLGAQEYAVVEATQVVARHTLPCTPATSCLGLLGSTTGLAAYVGCFYVLGSPKRSQTVVCTGATGAVGSTAVQLLKLTGARVIGVAGGPIKKEFLMTQLKLDGAVDYQHPKQSLEDQLAHVCPDGIDFVFDTVGGNILDATLALINPGGRVVICGAISQFSGNLSKDGTVQGPSNYLRLAEQGATMKGFDVMQYSYKLSWASFFMFLYHVRGLVNVIEQVEDGIEAFPLALEKMFTGGHIGKLFVKLADEDDIGEIKHGSPTHNFETPPDEIFQKRFSIETTI